MRKNVDMIAEMKKDGTIIPLTLIWDNGKKYGIDRVRDIKKMASTKGGGMGLRYSVTIKQYERYIWLDENVWFVEVDKNEVLCDT